MYLTQNSLGYKFIHCQSNGVNIETACKWISDGEINYKQYIDRNTTQPAVVKFHFVECEQVRLFIKEGKIPLYFFVTVSCYPDAIDDFVCQLKLLQFSQLDSVDWDEELRLRLTCISETDFAPELPMKFVDIDPSHISCGCHHRY